MRTLVGDRYICLEAAGGSTVQCVERRTSAIDAATGLRVRLTFRARLDRIHQTEWDEACVRRLLDPCDALIDFGMVGADAQFEAECFNTRASIPASGTPPPDILDWLETFGPTSARVLMLPSLPSARDIRLRGFVPACLRTLDHLATRSVLTQLFGGRSVVVLENAGEPARLSMALLALHRAGVRDACAFVAGKRTAGRFVTRAAEERAAYDVPHNRFTLKATDFGGESQARKVVDHCLRLQGNGRHAEAERTLKASVAAFDRRRESTSTAILTSALGQLLLKRGRAGDARSLFVSAEDMFRRTKAVIPAIRAAILSGVCLTDLAQFNAADNTLRNAYSAAFALHDADVIARCVVARARARIGNGQLGDALALLRAIEIPGEREVAVRYWSLSARLHLEANDLSAAWDAVAHARHAIAEHDEPSLEALVRTREAAIQARLGDLCALKSHADAGLAAAQRAHEPLRAMRLRLTLIEGLLRGGRSGEARAAARHLVGVKGIVPEGLQKRIDRLRDALQSSPVTPQISRPNRSHETAAVFQMEGAPAESYAALSRLLELCQNAGDDRGALNAVATAVRRQISATGVSIVANSESGPSKLAASGTVDMAVGRRAAETAHAIQPERAGGSVEAATPVRFLGRTIGAIIVRWTIEGPDHPERSMGLLQAVAMICAPLVYAVTETASRAGLCDPAPFDLAGKSSAMEDLHQHVRRAANAPFAVLIEGESGVGKELVARAIHQAGCRRERRFCALNCAAMPEDLVDAEMFGHAKGAFTGAGAERMGLFESAEGGTVFLDEVGELSARAQAKLLRVLQEGEIRRLGETFTRPVDTRLVAATNRQLRVEAEAGRFRQDLLYRLDVIRITVPPLRDRAEDIPLLATRFWSTAAERIGSRAVLGQSALSALARYHWPGNVRELQNVLSALVVTVPARGVVGASQIPPAIAGAGNAEPDEPLERARLKFEQRFVRAALARCAGHKSQAAAALGISRQGLAKLMHRLNLDG